MADTCNHRQCALCLQRECHKNERFKQIGENAFCSFCLVKAVTFTLKTAQMFGGAYYIPPGCGYAKKKAP